jgi:hypothetical protein
MNQNKASKRSKKTKQAKQKKSKQLDITGNAVCGYL